MPRPGPTCRTRSFVLAVLACLFLPMAFAGFPSSEPSTPPADTGEAAAVDDFLGALEAGDNQRASARLSDEARATLPMADVDTMWRSLPARHGRLLRHTPARAVVRSGRRLWVSDLRFERATLYALFRIDAQGRVHGFRVEASSPPPQPLPVEARGVTEQDFAVGDLPGQLVLPQEGTRLPALVIVHGSGTQDRDGTLGPNKPFRDIAYGLAQHGIATLRYDKRSRARPGTLTPASTADDVTVDDAVHAIALLRRHPRVDPERVFVLGHSLGGYLLPRIADRPPQPAGLIVMAGLSQPLYQSIPRQLRHLAELDGTVSGLERASVERAEEQRDEIVAMLAGGPEPKDPMLGIPPAYWRHLDGYDPIRAARALRQPMLLMQGGRDYQVTLEDDFSRWRNGLAGRDDTEFLSYPTLNHLFMAGEGAGDSREYFQPRPVAPEAISDLQRWIHAH